jgi:hypothetical protein
MWVAVFNRYGLCLWLLIAAAGIPHLFAAEVEHMAESVSFRCALSLCRVRLLIAKITSLSASAQEGGARETSLNGGSTRLETILAFVDHIQRYVDGQLGVR